MINERRERRGREETKVGNGLGETVVVVGAGGALQQPPALYWPERENSRRPSQLQPDGKAVHTSTSGDGERCVSDPQR